MPDRQRPGGSALDAEIDSLLSSLGPAPAAPSRGSSSLDAEIDALLSTVSHPKPSYADMTAQLRSKQPAADLSAASPFEGARTALSTPVTRPLTPPATPPPNPATVAQRLQPTPIAPSPAVPTPQPVSLGPAASPFEQARTALAMPPPPPPPVPRLGSAKTGGMAGMATAPLPVPNPVDLASGAFSAASGAFKAVPTAIGESLFHQPIPGHEQEPDSFLGRLLAHGQMILQGRGGEVEPMGPIRAATNPPDSVQTYSPLQRAALAQVGMPVEATHVRSEGEKVTEETVRRGMDMLGQMFSDPTTVAAMGVGGAPGELLAASFGADGIRNAVQVARNPHATKEDVAEAMLGAGLSAIPTLVHRVGPGAVNVADAAAAKAGQAMRAGILATKLQIPGVGASAARMSEATMHAGTHAPIAAMENIGGLEQPPPVGETVGDIVRTTVAPDAPPITYNQGRDRSVPVTPSETRPPQGPTTSAPPAAVRPGVSESAGPVAPSPEPPPVVAAAPQTALPIDLYRAYRVATKATGQTPLGYSKWEDAGRPSPPAATETPATPLDHEIDQVIAQVAGPEFVPVGAETPYAGPERRSASGNAPDGVERRANAPIDASNVVAAAQQMLEENPAIIRQAAELGQRARDSRMEAPPRDAREEAPAPPTKLDAEIDRFVADVAPHVEETADTHGNVETWRKSFRAWTDESLQSRLAEMNAQEADGNVDKDARLRSAWKDQLFALQDVIRERATTPDRAHALPEAPAAPNPEHAIPFGAKPVGRGRGTPVTPATTESAREFSSTQVALPKEHAEAVADAAARIPDADLADDGRETDPHVTVKFGLHTNDVEDVRRVLADEPPITVTLGKTSIFPAKEGAAYDVVKVDVDSPDLHRLNKKIADALPHTDTHPTYKPHVTLAYVKPGSGRNTPAAPTSLAGR
jgi:2'-5' RNA ligase